MFGDFEIKLSPSDNWQLKFINIFKEITISDDENEYKKKNFTKLGKDNEFSIEQAEEVRKEGKYSCFILNIISGKKGVKDDKEDGDNDDKDVKEEQSYHIQIRSGNRISLEYLVYHVITIINKNIIIIYIIGNS